MSGDRATSREVKSGGRLLAVEITGAPDGSPVFLLHGTPGSRIGPKPRGSVLYRRGIRLISYDRPGYGDSTRHEGRYVAHAAADVEAIADELRLDRFAVVGRSGGGPHALACAAMLPDRVTRAAVLVSLAPPDAAGLDWYDGMTEDNIRDFSTVDQDLPTLVDRLGARADRLRRDPGAIFDVLRDQLNVVDRRVVNDFAIRRLLADSYREALRTGPAGWIDDVCALRRPWGFSLRSITAPVRLWHGADDSIAPVGHTRWLARCVPGARIQVQTGAGHFAAVEILPEILSWLAAEPLANVRTG